MSFVDELEELALGDDAVLQVEARELDLARASRQLVRQIVHQPVVQGPVILKLEGAQRVRNALKRVGQRMCVVIHGVDLPLGARARVLRVALDPVRRRVAHVDVGRAHIDLEAENHLAIGYFSLRHLVEEREVLLDGALAVGRVAPGLRERAAVLTHLLRGQRVDVRLATLDKQHRHLVEAPKVVGRVREPLGHLPVEAEPADILLYRIDVLLLLLVRVRIVEAHVRHAAKCFAQPEVDADAFGVANVQVAVGLGREARHDLAVLARCEVLFHDLFQKVGALHARVGKLRSVGRLGSGGGGCGLLHQKTPTRAAATAAAAAAASDGSQPGSGTAQQRWRLVQGRACPRYERKHRQEELILGHGTLSRSGRSGEISPQQTARKTVPWQAYSVQIEDFSCARENAREDSSVHIFPSVLPCLAVTPPCTVGRCRSRTRRRSCP